MASWMLEVTNQDRLRLQSRWNPKGHKTFSHSCGSI